MGKICLFGASGHGKVVKDIAKSLKINVETFIDDNPKSKFIDEVPVKFFQELSKYELHEFIISIGNNRIRKIINEKIKVPFTKLIHNNANISPSVIFSEGTVVMAGVVINADTNIGKHVIINTSAVIEHDCKIGDFVHISPSVTITGNVSIGEGSHIGAGSVIIPNITIGKWVTIGAGSIIIKNIPDYAVVVGNPGKIIKYNNQ
jgi:sugar O-acyltransferase (sialic acid O-acetyltransferase NeuD family)